MERQEAIKQLKELKKIAKKEASGMRLAAEGWSSDWKLLITTILSARSRDETTIPVAEKMFKKYSSLKKISQAKIKDLENSVRPINFYKNKAKAVKACANMLIRDYKGKVPHDLDKLVRLPGVGRKTANIFLSENGSQAIAVDTHVFYISRKLDWTTANTPEKVERDLKELFPKKLWKEINPSLVRVGKTYLSKRKKEELLEKIKEIK